MKNLNGHYVLMFMTLLLSPICWAQTTPFCPTAEYVWFRSAVQPTLIPISTTETRIFIRQFFPGGFEYQFIGQNVVVTGNQISLDATGAPIPHPSLPTTGASLGILPAGSYDVTIHAIATNVTPNFTCPTFTVPLVVQQGAVDVPVPATTGFIATLLASLLGFIGVAQIRRRRPT